MKKSNWEWVIILLIIVFVIGIGIGIYLSTDAESTASDHKEQPQSKLDLVKARIKALEERVKNEIAQLQLTTEMENALSRKVDRICMTIGIVFFAIIALVVFSFYANGLDIVTAILSTTGLAALLFPLLSIILWRTVDLNSVVNATRTRIKQWLDKKYGHNPEAIAAINTSIVKSQDELSILVASTTSD
jgi:Na+/proline symporter